MSLYGRVDSTANQTAVGLTIGNSGGSVTKTIVFCDETEAALAANKGRGITAPGWWAYHTYTDSSGATRHRAEHLMVLTNPEANADETLSDDTIAADAANTITLSTNNTDKTTSSGAATFLVAASVTNSGTATFQWQKRLTSSGRFQNVSGATSTSLALTGQTAANDGNQYRVKVNSNNGAPEVISDVATLTFGSSMKFDELNESNYILFAIKHYENPHCVTRDDFDEDMKRFKYLKRLLKRYLRRGPLRIHLIINHLIILYNVFGEAATPLLFFKFEQEYWGILKTFLVYLNKYPVGMLPEIEIQEEILEHLERI